MVLSNEFYYERVQLDTINERFNKMPTAKEGDADGRGLIVVLTENGLVKNTTGVSLFLKWEHTAVADAQGIDAFEAQDLTKGEYIITYPTEMNHEGYVKAEVRIMDNGKYAGSRNMKIYVEPSVGDDAAIESSNQFSALVTALLEVNSWNARIDAVEQDFIDRANNLDATYAPDLVTVKAQLAHKVGGTVKAEPEDLSATTLGLLTGTGGPINLLSVPQDESVNITKIESELLGFLTGDFETKALPQPIVKNSLLKSNGAGYLWQHTDNLLIANDGTVSRTDGSSNVLTVTVSGTKVTVSGTNTASVIVIISGGSLRIGTTYNTTESLVYNGQYRLKIIPRIVGNPNLIFGSRNKSNVNVGTANSAGTSTSLPLTFDSTAACLYLNLPANTVYSNVEYDIAIIKEESYSAGNDYFTGYFKRYEPVVMGDKLIINAQSEVTTLETVGTTGDLFVPPDIPVIPPEVTPVNEKRFFVENVWESVSGIGGTYYKLFIYKNIGNGYYIRYKLTHATHIIKNMDVWVIHTAQLCQRVGDVFTVLKEVVNIGEWEMAVQITGAIDFIGGIAHGDEKNVSATLFIDGISKAFGDEGAEVAYVSEKFECDNIRVIVKSEMFHPDSAVYVGDHFKCYDFGENGVKVKQKVVWKAALNMTYSYLSMLPIKRTVGDVDGSGQITDRVYDDKAYEIVDCTLNDFTGIVTTRGRTGVNRYDIYGITSGISASVEVLKRKPELPNASSFVQQTNPTYNKIYFDFCGTSYTTAVDETWEFESIFNIDYKE